jgi:3-oxoacyl-[acyl-carrier protein] reductase
MTIEAPLEGRIALVTGGGRGIGRAIAVALAREGADAAISYRRDKASARETVSAIEQFGRHAGAYQASVDAPADDERLVAAVLDDFGGVDLLVNNAGIASRGQTVADTDPAEIDRLWRTHALGPMVLSKLVLPSMRARPRGDIVMISSIATDMMAANSSPYNMAKAAMEALAHTLAKEERAHGVHVNVVAPGLVDTEMGRRLAKAVTGADDIHALDPTRPFGRVCSPEDVAAMVTFLVSDRGAHLTDQRLTVDGGTF